MRIHAVFAVSAAFVACLALAAPACATAQPAPQQRTAGSAVSGSPTAIAGARSVGSASASFPGQVLDLSDFQRWSGQDSPTPRSGTHAIRNQEEWHNVWRKTSSGEPPRDFKSGEMAVAIFTGPKPSSGYSPGIVSIKRNGEDLYITYVLNKPRDASTAGDMKRTSPWLIQLVPSATGRVRFISVTSAVQ